jgi:hypothetical protein
LAASKAKTIIFKNFPFMNDKQENKKENEIP